MNINDTKINFKTRIFILVSCYLIFFISLSYFLIFPYLKYIKTTSENIVKSKITEEQYYMAKKETNNLEENLDNISKKIKEIEKGFVEKNQELIFIQELENLANKNQINQKISFESEECVVNEYKAIPVELDIIGSFENIMKYISALESANYFINIKSLTLTKSNSNIDYDNNSIENTEQLKKIHGMVLLDTYWK